MKQGSNQQINIPSSISRTIKKLLNNGGDAIGIDIFDAALKEVVAMLARDKLPRFLQDKSMQHRKDILASKEERQLKLKYDEAQKTLTELIDLTINRDVLSCLRSTCTLLKR